MTKTYKKFRPRKKSTSHLCFIWLFDIVFQAFSDTSFKSSQYQEVIVEQAQRKQILKANRGNIYDRKK